MSHRASIVPMHSKLRTTAHLAALILAAGGLNAIPTARADEPAPKNAPAPAPTPERTEAEQTADAYRAIFAKLPTDLEALNLVPSGRGLDSWKLFLDHPELIQHAEELLAIAARETCDFERNDSLTPSQAHHEPYNRAKNLLLHRAITYLHGDRTVPPDDFGNMPEPVGIDEQAATRYAVAMLNMAVHFGERGTLAERRIASVAAPDLMGIARRSPQGLPWAMDAIRASRYIEPIENLFGYQQATIAYLRFLATTIEQNPDQFIEAFELTPPDGNTTSPAFAGTIERHRWVFNNAAETLEAEWDTEHPMPQALALIRAMPRDLTIPRATLNEIARAAAEIAAVREDIRALLKAIPTEQPAESKAPDNDEQTNTPNNNSN